MGGHISLNVSVANILGPGENGANQDTYLFYRIDTQTIIEIIY